MKRASIIGSLLLAAATFGGCACGCPMSHPPVSAGPEDGDEDIPLDTARPDDGPGGEDGGGEDSPLDGAPDDGLGPEETGAEDGPLDPREDDGPGPDDGAVEDVSIECSIGLTPCTDGDGVVRCVDTSQEPCHCGGCGLYCPGPCLTGFCFFKCGFPFVMCGSAPDPCISGARPYCTDVNADPNNCGGCGQVCPPDTGCAGGACL